MGATTADKGRSLELPEAPGAVGRARDFARLALTGFGWLPAADPAAQTAADDVLLLVSELVTNACRHGSAPYRLTLHPTRRGIRVEVTDTGDTLPAVGPDQPTRPGGFGMRLIDTLAGSWGVTPHPTGKTVWCELTR